ncbi:MAG TPA: hypothetical protein VHS31_06630 [Tepidisphaeraceae bacterium]|jgi:hypothetical protein|nr:hypothetical protein [Tepidisphaeraceae bacterium]
MPQQGFGGAGVGFRSLERAIIWCFVRTARDDRLAKAAGRPLAGRNVGRLLLRRLGMVLDRPVRLQELDMIHIAAKGRVREGE